MNLRKYYPFIIIAILILLLVILWDKYQGQKMTAESRGSIIKEQNAELTYRKTKEGQLIADKVAAEARTQDLQEAYPRLAKVLADQMDVRLKNLKTAIQAEFRAINTGTAVLVRDTIIIEGKVVPVDSVSINDGFLAFRGELRRDKFAWDYSYQDSVTIALHVKKKWFLGKETLYSSIMLKNPNAKVTNSTTVQVKEFKDKRWVLSVGASYDPFSNTVRPGVMFGWRVIAF